MKKILNSTKGKISIAVLVLLIIFGVVLLVACKDEKDKGKSNDAKTEQDVHIEEDIEESVDEAGLDVSKSEDGPTGEGEKDQQPSSGTEYSPSDNSNAIGSDTSVDDSNTGNMDTDNSDSNDSDNANTESESTDPKWGSLF